MTKNNPIELLKKYLRGATLREIAAEHGVSPQYIHSLISKLAGYRPRKPDGSGTVIFNGTKYYRAGKYHLSSKNNKLLHRAIYESQYGAIPPNHDIHHIDGNRENNNITNLIMLTKSAHTKINASEIGRKGGKKSKRTWTPEQKEDMIKKLIETLRKRKVKNEDYNN